MKFINYHIPLSECDGDEIQYVSIGYFDGMITKRLDVDYEKTDLKELWKYSIESSIESQGKYSHQKIFCFSRDSWNKWNDEYFWAANTDKIYPLSFVVFFQLSNYLAGKKEIEEQCKCFNEKLKTELGESGLFYTYSTIDKNDLVVCIKSKNYRKTVKAIKKLHGTGQSVVYSYSIFSINKDVLSMLNEINYPDIYKEKIDSISLKGIVNSYGTCGGVTLDKKYNKLSRELVKRLYVGEPEGDNRVYDILGDDDFRLIARNVRLGRLLEQYGPNGVLSYHKQDSHFRFYLYSSSMLLNTITDVKSIEYETSINDMVIQRVEDEMNKTFVTPKCDELLKEMGEIKKYIQNVSEPGINEKVVTFCQGLWQLLQSLKVLEAAPTKKYDFYSLYHPLSALIRILTEKLKEKENIGEEEEIYEFIHKISMTLHGTLRTDIQFFQIRDFNVVVHYAPAKLRAFYAIWALELAEYYNSFGNGEHGRYSFIFSPGMFKGTFVRELFLSCDEKERVMLITLPERHLYLPKWLTIILSHEVSHFVGRSLRNRKLRHETWIRISTRIVSLEWNSFIYGTTKDDWKYEIEGMLKDTLYIQNEIENIVFAEEKERRRNKPAGYEYHSENSLDIIMDSYRQIRRKRFDKLFTDYRIRIANYLEKKLIVDKVKNTKNMNMAREICIYCNNQEKQWSTFLIRFFQEPFIQILRNVKYIMSETFADLMAILTLHLTPEDYILLFIKTEYIEYENEMSSFASAVNVRIGLTIETMKRLVKDNKRWYEKEDKIFAKRWSEKVWGELAKKFEYGSTEDKFVVLAYGYQRDIIDFMEEIEKYRGLYNYNEEIFSNPEKEYLKDKFIYQQMLDYLYECGKCYINELMQENEVINKQRKLREKYQVVAGKDVLEMVQEIENFLASYEMCH